MAVTSRSSLKRFFDTEPVSLSELGRRFFEPGATNDTDIETKVVITTSFTVSSEDVILVDDDTAGADVTIFLPAAADRTKPCTIKKLGNTGKVFVDGDGSETIDDELQQILGSQYNSITVAPNNSNWFIL